MKKNKKMKVHTHYDVVAYNERDEIQIRFPVKIGIINSGSEADAIWEAKEIVKRKNYFVEKAWQCRKCIEEDYTEKVMGKQLDALDKQTKMYDRLIDKLK